MRLAAVLGPFVAAVLGHGFMPPSLQGQTSPFTIPTLDLADEPHRQVVVDREPGQYLGHPTTVFLEDGISILTVYPKGHGRGPIVMKMSPDGGLTWSERLPTLPAGVLRPRVRQGDFDAIFNRATVAAVTNLQIFGPDSLLGPGWRGWTGAHHVPISSLLTAYSNGCLRMRVSTEGCLSALRSPQVDSALPNPCASHSPGLTC